MAENEEPNEPCDRLFTETHWTLIHDVREGGEVRRHAALERLCARYWLPLYCFARKCGLAPEDAEDLIQDFFENALRKDLFAQADQAKGRLRCFLLGGLKFEIRDWRRRESAVKRGGGLAPLSLDRDAEEIYGHEPVDDASPDELFNRKWAESICAEALDQVARRWARRGRMDEFTLLRPLMLDRPDAGAVAGIAGTLGLTSGNVRVKLTRLRRELEESIRRAVAATVTNPAELEEELRELGLSH